MEVNIQKRTNNPHLKRETVECMINFEEGTPNSEEIKSLVAKALVANPELVVINRLLQQFGSKQARVIACVYKDSESMKKVHKETGKEVGKTAETPAA